MIISEKKHHVHVQHRRHALDTVEEDDSAIYIPLVSLIPVPAIFRLYSRRTLAPGFWTPSGASHHPPALPWASFGHRHNWWRATHKLPHCRIVEKLFSASSKCGGVGLQDCRCQGRILQFCASSNYPLAAPQGLISTRDKSSREPDCHQWVQTFSTNLSPFDIQLFFFSYKCLISKLSLK